MDYQDLHKYLLKVESKDETEAGERLNSKLVTKLDNLLNSLINKKIDGEVLQDVLQSANKMFLSNYLEIISENLTYFNKEKNIFNFS